jgi:hypothetical protein
MITPTNSVDGKLSIRSFVLCENGILYGGK